MREKIKLLAKENFEYELPVILLSEEKIHISIEAGTTFRGSFSIQNNEGMDMKGVVYSNESRMRIINPMFIGKSNEIQYSFNGKRMEPGEVQKGRIHIISNCGETWIPFLINAIKPFCHTSMGNIQDLFQFANLAQVNWKEALGLFESEEFSRVFIEKEEQQNLYKSLKKSYSSSIAMEEFLLKVQKKLKLNIILEKESFIYPNCTMSFMDKIVFLKDSWGYELFTVSTEGVFLSTEKTEITTDDFLSNHYELEFLVDYTQLRAGNNFGKIIISSASREMTADVQVIVRHEEDSYYAKHQIKADKLSFIQNYLNLRTNQITHDEYSLELAGILKRARSYFPHFEYLIMETHYYITDCQQGAELCLKELEENLDRLKEVSPVCYCAYFYLKASYTKEEKDINKAIETIKFIYEREEDRFEIFWFLLYLEEEYELSPDKKWRETLAVLESGVTSPVLYFEVCDMVRKNNNYLKQLTPALIRSLNWGIKVNFLTRELVEGYCFLLLQEGQPPKSTLRHFIDIYEKYPGRELLNSICLLIIQQKKKDSKYFKWFILGEEAKLRLENFYEYYLYNSPEDFSEKIPSSVLTFFSYDNEISWEKKAYLYAYIVKNKNKDMATYVNYHKQIRKFVYEQIKKEQINSNLAVLYEEFIEIEELEEGTAINLAKIMFRHEVICQNPKMTGVYIRHKELETENYAELEKGKAYIDISTENVTISFSDRRGNRYVSSIDYTVTRLLQIPGLVSRCFELCKTNPMILLALFENIDQYQKENEDSISIQRRCVLLPNFNRYYKGRSYERLIEYYFDHMEQKYLEEVLRIVDFETVSKDYREKIIQYSMIHGLRERAIFGLQEYGFTGIPLNRLIKFCAEELERQLPEEKNDFLLELCHYIFSEGKYNEAILNYLILYYNGDTKSMLALWKSADGFGLDTYCLEERILCQSLFAESHVRRAYEVFCSYYKKGGEERIICAFLRYNSFKYLAHDRPLKEDVFRILQKELNYEDSTLNRLAVIKYFSEMDGLSQEELDFCERSIWKFKEKNLILPFFKKFEGKVTLPEEITNYYYVEYKCNPKKQVKIHYIADGKETQKNYIMETMRNVYFGIHVKAFLLFQDEHLSYYISEKDGETENITQSVKVVIDNVPEADDSIFGLLNLMVTAREMQDEKTLLDLMEYFVKLKYTSEKLFEIL